MPFINADDIVKMSKMLIGSEFDIVTMASKMSEEEAKSSSNVKVVIDQNDRAMYFSRSMIPFGANEFLYHIGVYGFKIQALKQFIVLAQSNYEKCEKLEQLRALEHGMKIGVVKVKQKPISIDNHNDFKQASNYYHNNITSKFI